MGGRESGLTVAERERQGPVWRKREAITSMVALPMISQKLSSRTCDQRGGGGGN
jgi:hypothetical protein